MGTVRKRFDARTYNLVAKILREQFPSAESIVKELDIASEELIELKAIVETSVCMELAFKFADKFALDNQYFDVKQFLTQCSPNLQTMPLDVLYPKYLEHVAKRN